MCVCDKYNTKGGDVKTFASQRQLKTVFMVCFLILKLLLAGCLRRC